jgi:hypothetical protein
MLKAEIISSLNAHINTDILSDTTFIRTHCCCPFNPFSWKNPISINVPSQRVRQNVPEFPKSIKGKLIKITIGTTSTLDIFDLFRFSDNDIFVRSPGYTSLIKSCDNGYYPKIKGYEYQYCLPGKQSGYYIPRNSSVGEQRSLLQDSRIDCIFRKISVDNRGWSWSTYYIKYNHESHPDILTLRSISLLKKLRRDSHCRLSILPKEILLYICDIITKTHIRTWTQII